MPFISPRHLFLAEAQLGLADTYEQRNLLISVIRGLAEKNLRSICSGLMIPDTHLGDLAQQSWTPLSDTLHKVNHGKISKFDRTRHSQAYRTQRWLWLSESAQQG